MKRLILIIALLLLWLPVLKLAAQTDTPTPSPSPSPTPAPVGGNIVLTPAVLPTSTAGPLFKGDGCSPFLPCGPLPWPVPRFPTLALASPTAIPTIPTATPRPATATPTETPTATPTPTGWVASTTPTATLSPTPTLEGGLEDLATLTDGMSNIALTLQAQMTQQVTIRGTPTGLLQIASDIGRYMGAAFGIANGFANMDSLTFGAITLFLLSIGFTVIINLFAFIAPVLISMLRFLITLWQAIKPF